jgi:hypothetical protein
VSNQRYGPLDVALYLVGVAGLAACLTLVWFGMRAVMNVGGFCAEGGPYVIDTPCPEGVPIVMVLSIFGLFGFGGLMTWKGQLIGGAYAGLVALAWPALFISLGWNFLEYAIKPPEPDYGIVWGWLIPGILFVVMGAAPLVMLLPSRRVPGGGRGLSGMSSLVGVGDSGGSAGVDGDASLGGTDSAADLLRARKRLLNDLVTTAHERGWGVQDDMVSKLERLASLRNAGVLTGEEFELAKRAILRAG